jgi:glutathionylspermidine synthase
MSKLEIRRRAFSPVKFSLLRNLLRTGAFTDQKQQMRRRLFSLCDFEKSENEKYNWYHYSNLRLERVKGIEPSLLP